MNATVPNDVLLQTYSRKQWERLGTQKRAGVLVPVFSIYSEDSTGIGDFLDLKKLVDWCVKSGQSVLQLLPMNELGPIFCPYDSVSSFALEPMFLALGALEGVKAGSAAGHVKDLAGRFPAGEQFIDYRIKGEKLRVLWEIYEGLSPFRSRSFDDFIDRNRYWLDDFALFNYLKFIQQGKAWWDWERRYLERDPSAIANLRRDHAKEINFHKWVQWQAYGQFSAVQRYAKGAGVLLKGDLPILVSRDSADVWSHPEFFKLDYVAGAPPDMYCAKGQRWGTPTYQWDTIFADGGRYVKEKLAYAQNFYDILRIDHVVGLFRIWSIPFGEPMETVGLNGKFDPVDENRWESQGRKILQFMADNTSMLLCAEDLGVVPPAATKVLKELGIPGNEVQRWVKDWKTKHDFLPPDEYRQLSVSMLSTHDTTNWAAWWENEAGTVDEGLFMRRCQEKGIDFVSVKPVLFDEKRSRHGRLRWREQISSVDVLLQAVGRGYDDAWHLVDLYKNSFGEKEKLWKQLGMAGQMSESYSDELVKAVILRVFNSNSIFCINLITDLLYLAGLVEGDPYEFRMNTPGTVTDKNWSRVLPLSLEEMLGSKVTGQIKKIVKESGRE